MVAAPRMLLTATLCSALPLLAAAQSVANQLYTPTGGACPADFSLVRFIGNASHQALGAQEAEYIANRSAHVLPGAWAAYLANLDAANVSVLPDYVASVLSGNASGGYPTLGIASSGGGYRAALFGAGVLNAIDGRNASSVALGTGGLLQATTYLAGLSGSSILVTSLAQANFPTIRGLIFGDPLAYNTSNAYGGWLTQFGQMAPTGDAALDDAYIQYLIEEVSGKLQVGFALSYNDVYARDFARHVLNGTIADNFFNESIPHGAGVTFSGIADLPSFVAYEQPFPIITSTLISQHGNFSTIINSSTVNVPQSNPMFEMNVYEVGSYDPTLAAFTPTKFLGTTNSSVCVTGYDQATFLVGASCDFDTVYNSSAQAELNNPMFPVIEALNQTYPQANIDLGVALFPNAFYGVTNGTFIDAGEHYFGLTDGGNNGEPIPIQPLLAKPRGVDVILTADGMSDTPYTFAAGSSIINTQNRSTLFPGWYNFPPVPTSIAQFVAQNLSTSPTFFGCNSTVDTPLLIYLANGGPPHDGAPTVTNITASELPLSQIQPILDQVFVLATQGRPADPSEATDPQWPACLACAVVDRARNRTGVERSGVCASCFERYCWDGSTYGS